MCNAASGLSAVAIGAGANASSAGSIVLNANKNEHGTSTDAPTEPGESQLPSMRWDARDHPHMREHPHTRTQARSVYWYFGWSSMCLGLERADPCASVWLLRVHLAEPCVGAYEFVGSTGTNCELAGGCYFDDGCEYTDADYSGPLPGSYSCTNLCIPEVRSVILNQVVGLYADCGTFCPSQNGPELYSDCVAVECPTDAGETEPGESQLSSMRWDAREHPHVREHPRTRTHAPFSILVIWSSRCLGWERADPFASVSCVTKVCPRTKSVRCVVRCS